MGFTFQDTRYHIAAGDYVILPNATLGSDFSDSGDFQGIFMSLSDLFITSIAIRSNYGIIGHLSLLQNPVMKLSFHDFRVCKQAMLCIRERMEDKGHLFREELLGSLLTAHILDLYDIHARRREAVRLSEHITFLLRKFIELLYNGEYIRHRSLDFYASRLCITPHYLSALEAGLGGGSADAAAVLRALNRAYDSPLSIPALCELGAQVGSDVPFCVMGGTALVEGKGELLTRLPPAPEFFVVICKPDFSVSTPELYQALDETFIEKRPDQKVMQLNLQKGDLLGIGGSLCNVFEPVVMQKHFDINYIRSMMYTYGAYGAQMTGSGSAVFGIYDSFEYATVACTMLKDKYSQIFLAKTV